MRSVRMWSRGRFNQEALSHARTVKGDKRGSAGAQIYREQDCLPRCWASGNWQSLPLGAVWKFQGVCVTCQECRARIGGLMDVNNNMPGGNEVSALSKA